LATGSALTWDGTNFGIGATPSFLSGGGLGVYNASNTRIKLTNSTTGTGTFDGMEIQIGASDANIIVRENFPLLIYTNNGEAMRITEGRDVGIGTSSPAYKLDVSGSIHTSSLFVLDNNNYIGFKESTNTSITSSIFNDTSNNLWIYNGSATSTRFYTNATERARIPAAGGFQSVTTISVGNATPSSSGAGLTFPATQSASSDANTLDDYEEGTWTPTFFGTTTAGSPTYGTQAAIYTKIGRSVSVSCYINISNKGGMAGNLQMGGLPFSSNGGSGLYGAFAIAEHAGLTAASGKTYFGIEIAIGATTMTIYDNGSGVSSNQHSIANTDDSTYIIFAGTYQTA